MIEQVVSRDGTPIAVWRSGAGPPLLLVHGTTADHTRWAPVLPALEERFTVLAMDRRGRGKSEDADDYAFEREFEDVAAVIESAPGRVDVLGHSHGGVCALEAALLTERVRKLVLRGADRVRRGPFPRRSRTRGAGRGRETRGGADRVLQGSRRRSSGTDRHDALFRHGRRVWAPPTRSHARSA
jgi:pimeloyl-ACP methyl ester carboxylesterase